MAQKTQEKGVTGTAPVVDTPSNVRNVVLVGHSGSGKTTLAETLLVSTGVIGRAGSIADGTTTCDHDPAAVKQQRSVSLACAPLTHDKIKINLLDSPGYADYVGELRAGLRAADAALFVVSAVDGVDTATVSLWDECAAVGMPRAVAITRIDHPRADFEETVAQCQRVFGDGAGSAGNPVLPHYLPLHNDAGDQVVGTVGLLTQRVFDYSDGYPPQVREPDAEHLSATEEARNALIEGIIAESEDETLMDRYLSGEQMDEATLIDDLETAVARASFFPVIPVCGDTQVGVDALLEVLTQGFPSPLEHELPAVTTIDGGPHEAIACDPDGPLAAEVVKTTIDPYLGRVSMVRVFSGTLRPENVVHVSGHGMTERGHPDHDSDERIAHIYSPLGGSLREVPYCVAGDICAITK
ncbi:MAG: GTP-binding protein, partial [Micromonosporaceae bacterium]